MTTHNSCIALIITLRQGDIFGVVISTHKTIKIKYILYSWNSLLLLSGASCRIQDVSGFFCSKKYKNKYNKPLSTRTYSHIFVYTTRFSNIHFTGIGSNNFLSLSHTLRSNTCKWKYNFNAPIDIGLNQNWDLNSSWNLLQMDFLFFLFSFFQFHKVKFKKLDS